MTSWASSSSRAQAVVVTSGGIGGDHDLVRANWPPRAGDAAGAHGRRASPRTSTGGCSGSPRRRRRRDQPRPMWHYVEGIANWDPVWRNHGIRILPGPSSLWLDATGGGSRAPLFPGSTPSARSKHVMRTATSYSWFVLTSGSSRRSSRSGSEQNPDVTGQEHPAGARPRAAGRPSPVEAFKQNGVDFVVADTLPELVRGMNELVAEPRSTSPSSSGRSWRATARSTTASRRTPRSRRSAVRAGTAATAHPRGEAAPPPRSDAGPLIAVRLSILTRKTLGGLETDLESRVLRPAATPSRGSTRPARSAASAAAGCTATARSRAPSSAAASSRAGGGPGAVAAAL